MTHAKDTQATCRRRQPTQLLCLVLDFLLCGALLLAVLCNVVYHRGLKASTLEWIAEKNNLADTAYATLESYFTQRENATGIEASVYMDAITVEELATLINEEIELGITYLEGSDSTWEYHADFLTLDIAIEEFFTSYAMENGYAFDDTYYERVESVETEAHEEILSVVDVYELSTLYANGILQKLQTVYHLLGWGCYLSDGLVILLVGLLFLCCRKRLHLYPYWIGLGVLISSLWCGIPSGYLLATDYVSAFAIKDPMIYAAVVGYLNHLLESVLVCGSIGTIFGTVLLAFFAVMHKRKKAR